MGLNSDERYAQAAARREIVLALVKQGQGIEEALADQRVNVSHSAYRKWRGRYPKWATEVDVARSVFFKKRGGNLHDMTSAQFAKLYFGRERTWFQQRWIESVQALPPGNILLTLWPPEYGKTSTFEDYATETIARNPAWCCTVASENGQIAEKIIGTVKNRMEPNGPTRAFIRDWGPFRADSSSGPSMRQPWAKQYFSVKDHQMTDQRDYNMLAIGWGSSTVSIRTDHLHVDDLCSTKSIQQSKEQLNWLRQDALTRPGESGISTISGTRVDDGDPYESLLDDDEMIDAGILEILKFPAIWYDGEGNPQPLWPDKHDLVQLERIRIKIKDRAFDRNYLMEPNRSKTKTTFVQTGRDASYQRNRTLNVPDEWDGRSAKPHMVLSLDPGMDPGYSCFGAWHITKEWMRLIYFDETDKFMQNEEIIGQIAGGARICAPHYKLRHASIEAMNFQRGLARDEDLKSLAERYNFTIGEHYTGVNKYDPTIGIATMATDFNAGRIQLPYNPDDEYTKTEIDEFWLQFKRWKPGKRGTELRMDRVMMTWFAWIYWIEHRESLDPPPATAWKREGLGSGILGQPYQPIFPTGALQR